MIAYIDCIYFHTLILSGRSFGSNSTVTHFELRFCQLCTTLTAAIVFVNIAQAQSIWLGIIDGLQYSNLFSTRFKSALRMHSGTLNSSWKAMCQ